MPAEFGAGADRMCDHRHRGREVVGQFGGAQEGHVGASARHRGHLGVVGRDDDALEQARALRHADGVADHRPAGEGRRFLRGTRLLPPRAGITAMRGRCSCQHRSQHAHHAIRCAGVSAGNSGSERARVVALGGGKVAAREAKPLVVGLGVDGDVVHVDADAGLAQRGEGLAAHRRARRVDLDGVEVPGAAAIVARGGSSSGSFASSVS